MVILKKMRSVCQKVEGSARKVECNLASCRLLMKRLFHEDLFLSL